MEDNRQKLLVPAEISARHVHLSQEHVEILFGKGHTLTEKRPLSQPGQFLCEERVRLIGSKGVFESVAVLGPARPSTQVEISRTDCVQLGIEAPLRESGDLNGCAPILIAVKNTFLPVLPCAMVAKRHIHMTHEDAAQFGVRDTQTVSVRLHTERPVILEDVVIRCSDQFRLFMHIDTDEANACLFKPGMHGEIIG